MQRHLSPYWSEGVVSETGGIPPAITPTGVFDFGGSVMVAEGDSDDEAEFSA